MTVRTNSNSVLCVLLALLCLLPACGGGGAATVPPPPPPPPAKIEILYATSLNNVMAFAVDTTSGALGTPTSVAGPNTSYGIVVNPAGQFLYVSDTVNDTVNTYSINASTGVLTAVGAPVAVGAAPGAAQTAAGMAMDPAGKFLYATDLFASRVAAFTANGSNGGLTAVLGSPFATAVSGGVVGSNPRSAVTDPAGKFLFVSDQGDPLGGISAYTINLTTGALTLVPGAPFASLVSGGPYALAVHPNGKFLYAGQANAGKVVAFTINSDGSLTTVVGFPPSTGASPIGLAIDPSGKFLYTANFGDSTISAFNIDATSGSLTAIGSAVAVGAQPHGLAIDPSGKFLYVTNPQAGAAGTITGFSINTSTGALTKFAGQPFAAGNGPVSLTVATIP